MSGSAPLETNLEVMVCPAIPVIPATPPGSLPLATAGGGVSVTFNPTKLPQLLRQLHLTNFNELEGTYVQIPLTKIGQECEGIRYIMAKEGEEWFKSENHTFFGCNFYEGYNIWF